jgi:nitroimidazol reductase NimA-like FMN-containing flavoprotein (pyridoxamine 5'-phosphate oxidase superfamily)
MGPALTREIIAILSLANDLTIATVREDGYPQATTVSYVNDGLTIYFGCAAQSQKAKNIGQSAKISITSTCHTPAGTRSGGCQSAAKQRLSPIRERWTGWGG